MNRLTEENIDKIIQGGSIILYGAGRIGKNTANLLKDHGHAVSAIFDENAACWGNYEGIEVRKPEYIETYKDYLIILCIFSSIVCEEVQTKLERMGYRHFIVNEELPMKLLGCKWGGNPEASGIRECSKCLVEGRGCDPYRRRYRKESGFGIHELGLLVTTACTLNCQGCTTRVGEYRAKNMLMQYDMDVFIRCWQKLIQAVDYIEVAGISGGEAFLYPGLEQLLTILTETEKVKAVSVLTNGTVMPKPGLIPLLERGQVVVSLDNYGCGLNEDQQARVKAFRELLIEHGINYTEIDNSHGTWYDIRQLQDQNRTPEENEEVFKNCMWNNDYCLMPDMKIEVCPVQNLLEHLGYPYGKGVLEEVSVDLLSVEEDQIRRKLEELFSRRVLPMCSYCRGSDSGNVIPAGVQAYGHGGWHEPACMRADEIRYENGGKGMNRLTEENIDKTIQGGGYNPIWSRPDWKKHSEPVEGPRPHGFCDFR